MVLTVADILRVAAGLPVSCEVDGLFICDQVQAVDLLADGLWQIPEGLHVGLVLSSVLMCVGMSMQCYCMVGW